MPISNIADLLSANPYPGRGIVLGRSEDLSRAYVVYFIMGRSENSRNRVFTQKGNTIVTEPADPAKLQDPSLILYTPLRRAGEALVVTNGDQTGTICDHLERGLTFEDALRTRTFEPDAPNFTPRISGELRLGLTGFSYKLSILKSAQGNDASVQRFFYEYSQPLPGQGHLIHTYERDDTPLPAFVGEPRCVAVTGSLDAFASQVWENLNADNKVSLFARSITLDAQEDTLILNKYSKL